MIDFSNKTYANIRDAMLRDIPDDLDKREGGVIMTSIAPSAYAIEEFYLALDQVQRNAFLGSAVGKYLDYIGESAGTERQHATNAVRLGVCSAEIPLDSRFSTIDGENSVVYVATKHLGGTNYEMTAATPGTIGNEYIGQILPIDFIYGLEYAEITTVLAPGEDTETDTEYRERIILSLREKPFGGNVQSYIDYISKIDGVGGVQVYPVWNGGGTVKCSIIGADLNPCSQELIDRVQTEIDPEQNSGLGLGMAPIGASVTIGTCTEKPIAIEANVKLAPGYNIDAVEAAATQAITDYYNTLKKDWAKPYTEGNIDYAMNVYVAKVTAVLLSVDGIVNATDVKLNNSNNDIALTENATTQEIPSNGGVVLNVEV